MTTVGPLPWWTDSVQVDPVRRTVIGLVVLALLAPTLLFASAGAVRWPMGWAYIGVVVVGSAASHLLLARRRPALVRHPAYSAVTRYRLLPGIW